MRCPKARPWRSEVEGYWRRAVAISLSQPSSAMYPQIHDLHTKRSLGQFSQCCLLKVSRKRFVWRTIPSMVWQRMYGLQICRPECAWQRQFDRPSSSIRLPQQVRVLVTPCPQNQQVNPELGPRVDWLGCKATFVDSCYGSRTVRYLRLCSRDRIRTTSWLF